MTKIEHSTLLMHDIMFGLALASIKLNQLPQPQNKLWFFFKLEPTKVLLMLYQELMKQRNRAVSFLEIDPFFSSFDPEEEVYLSFILLNV